MTNIHRACLFATVPIMAVIAGCGGQKPAGPSSDATPTNLPAPAVSNGQKPVAPKDESSPHMTGLPTSTPAMATPAAPPVAMAPAIKTLQFNAASIQNILAGKKTSTTRKGVRAYPSGQVLAQSGKSQPVRLEHVTTVTKKVSELTDADAKSDGSDSLDDMKSALMKNYPDLTPDDLVTVITFTPAPMPVTQP